MRRDSEDAREHQWGAALGRSNGSAVATEQRPDAPTTSLPDMRWGADPQTGQPAATSADTTALRWNDVPVANGSDAPGYPDDSDSLRLRDRGGDFDDAAPASRPTKRTRPGLVVAVAFLVELVLIAAGANQAVMRHVLDVARDQTGTIQGSLAEAASVFAWRIGPQTGARDVWYGQFATIGGILVLTALLVLAVVRGAASWGRVFFGTWMAITVATVIAHVGGLITARPYYLAPGSIQPRYLPTGRHPGLVRLPASRQALYAAFDSSIAYAVVAGLGLGLIVALIVSIVAVATRRTLVVEPAAAPVTDAYVPEPPPPYYGETTALPAPPPQAPNFGPSDPYAAYAPTGVNRAAPDLGDRWRRDEVTDAFATRTDASRPVDITRDEYRQPIANGRGSDDAAEHATTALPAVDEHGDLTRAPGATASASGVEPAAAADSASSDEPVSSDEPAAAAEPVSSTDAAASTEPAERTDAATSTERAESADADEVPPAAESRRGARTWPPRQPTAHQTAVTERSGHSSEAKDDQRTAAFPVPPDDEDFDHSVDPD